MNAETPISSPVSSPVSSPAKAIGAREWFVILALLIYCSLSSPFPNSYKIGEIAIGILLILASFYDFLLLLARILKGENHLKIIVFAWLITVPTLVGIWRWEFSDLIRDLIPLFYLFIPLFLFRWYKDIDRSRVLIKIMPYVYSVVGVVFAIRYFVSNGIGIRDLAQKAYFFNNLMYYSYDPMVTFSSIFLLLTAVRVIHSRGLNLSTCLVVGMMIILALIGVGSLAGAILRAPLALIALSLFFLIFRYSIRSTTTALAAIAISFIVFSIFQEQFVSMFWVFLNKTYAVGENGKLEEFSIILSNLSEAPLLGLGWGATYYNPVLNFKVRFSHSIISFYFLKTGLIGLILLSTYLGWLVKLYCKSFRIAWTEHVDALPLLFAIGSTLLIGLLQVTYKTFSYAMVMVLVPVLYRSLMETAYPERNKSEQENGIPVGQNAIQPRHQSFIEDFKRSSPESNKDSRSHRLIKGLSNENSYLWY